MEQQNRWAIFNRDLAAGPARETFRMVLPPASEGFVHRAELVNTVGNATYLDDPLTNGKADALVAVTQNSAPGGGTMVYNRDNVPMPDWAAFNVAISESDGSAR